MKKIIFIFSLIVISLTSCEKLCQPVEDPADKFVGKYEVTITYCDDFDNYVDEEVEYMVISKSDQNHVYVSKMNKYATVENDMILFEDFHTYDGTSFTEYKFSPGIYSNGIFTINVIVIENTGYNKMVGNLYVTFTKIR